MSTHKCPGCGKVRVNGRWVNPEEADPEEVGNDFTDDVCRPCRDDKSTRQELLNEGVNLEPAR